MMREKLHFKNILNWGDMAFGKEGETQTTEIRF